MLLYKVTDRAGQTHGKTLWGEGVENAARGPEEQGLCSNAWIHAYADPLVATFVWRTHVNFIAPRLWEAEGEVGLTDGLKVGCRRLRTLREIPWPAVTTEQYVRFTIACAWPTAPKAWQDWARNWLSAEDRSVAAAAEAEAEAVWEVARTATWVARFLAEGATESALVSTAEVADMRTLSITRPNFTALAKWAVTSSIKLPEGGI